MTSTNHSQFKRVLKSFDVLALGFGAMIGWGWVVLAGSWVADAGSLGAVTAFVFGGLAMVLVGLIYAELAAAIPEVGGEHAYSQRALGRFPSFVCTWAIIFGYASVVAFEAVALPTVIEYLVPGYKTGFLWSIAGSDVYFSWVMVGMTGAIVITTANYFGVKTASFFQKLATILIAVVGVMFVSGALFEGSVTNMEPIFTDGVPGIFRVLVMVPFLFVGFDVIPQVAEEVDLPFKKIGLLIIVSVSMAVVWYILIVFGVSLVLSPAELSVAELAVPAAANAVFGGAWAGKLIIIAGIAGILTSWNAFLVGGSRATYALARAGLLPAVFAKLHPKHNTPCNAILLIGGFSALAPLLGRSSMVWFVDAGGMGIVIAYAMVALSFLVLRRKEPDMVRPYVVPMGNILGVLTLCLSLGILVLYLPGSPAALVWPHEWLLFLGWFGCGLVLYKYATSAGATQHA